MTNFTYYNPTKIVFGKGVNRLVGKELARNGIKKVLLLAGGGSIKTNGVYASICESLSNAQIKWHEVWGVRPNPVLSKVNEAIAHARQHHVDAIIAVGGGSVIDSAKATAAGMYLDDIWDAFEEKVKIKKALPLFCVLTLSATGSEMNPYAVITNEIDDKKWSTGGEVLYPVASFIDPEVQASLPWHQTVNGAIDAMAHIMEYYFLGSTEETTLSINEALLRTIVNMTDRLQKNAQDHSARANLAWAATLALNGITGAALRGGDWSVHAIEHGISALHSDIAHGAGLGVVYPAWIRFMQPHSPEIFERWAKTVWNASTTENAVQNFIGKLKDWKAPVTLHDLHISPEAIPNITANIMAAGYKPGAIKQLDEKDIQTILTMCT